MPEPIGQTKRDLKHLGFSLRHLRALNEYLKLYSMDVHRVPHKGWRAWRAGRKHEHFTYTVHWFHDHWETILEQWMEDPHSMAMYFLKLEHQEAIAA